MSNGSHDKQCAGDRMVVVCAMVRDLEARMRNVKPKVQPLRFSTPGAVRHWLEHGKGKGLLKEITDVWVAKETERLTMKIEEAKLLQRQSVVVVLESDGQLREVYGSGNVSVVVRAMLAHDEEDELEAEEYLLATLPYGIRRSVGVFKSRGLVRTWPIFGQTAEEEERRWNQLAVLRAAMDGTLKEVIESWQTEQ